MDLLKVRKELQMGRSIYDLPMRVTFYARVSTDMDVQLNSLENQIQYYTELIQSKPNWTFVPGYVDEGISGGTTKKREDFLRMIRDAKAGFFDFIITKEISRFSRSTMDSIQYTQELLEHGVGVFFQNDNINTFDRDSEFRLVVMAGVAQDELRKLSERIQFGHRQAIKNGHVLGNDKLYGYNKSKCVLTIKEDEAELIRTIFDLYANQGLGVRRVSQKLLEMGYTSRKGNAFNELTIKHILTNPKYKGWYCGNKSQSLDYRTKKKAFLDESEWVMYPDPTIPAIVSEDLWDRANAIYKERSRQSMEHANGASYHNRYAYSGKIICEEHETTYQRQTHKTKKGETEVWNCKIVRKRGRKACSSPQLRTEDLNQIMAEIFTELMKDKETIIESLISVLQSIPQDVDYTMAKQRIEEDIEEVNAKKDKLLELSLAGAIQMAEFKNRNDSFNKQFQALETQLVTIQTEETRAKESSLDIAEIRRVLDKELSFSEEINGNLATTILDKIVVKKGSTKEEINLDIQLKLGKRYEVAYGKEGVPTCTNPSIRDKARGSFLWRTTGNIMSAYYGRRVKISWNAVLQ